MIVCVFFFSYKIIIARKGEAYDPYQLPANK